MTAVGDAGLDMHFSRSESGKYAGPILLSVSHSFSSPALMLFVLVGL